MDCCHLLLSIDARSHILSMANSNNGISRIQPILSLRNFRIRVHLGKIDDLVGWNSAFNQFIDDFASTRGGLDELLMCVYKKVDVLLFDDLQSLSKKKKAQKRFSVLLEYLIEHGRRVIVTSECLPVHMKLEECLIKQLDVGVPIPVEPPDVETKVNLLRAMTSSSCQFLSEDMLRKIAERVESNIRDLKGAVKFVSAQMEMDERSDVVSAVEKWQRQRQQKGVIKQVKRGSESKFQSPLPIAV